MNRSGTKKPNPKPISKPRPITDSVSYPKPRPSNPRIEHR